MGYMKAGTTRGDTAAGRGASTIARSDVRVCVNTYYSYLRRFEHGTYMAASIDQLTR